MKFDEIDPAIKLDKFHKQNILKSCMITSLHVSGSNENVNFKQSIKFKTKSQKLNSFCMTASHAFKRL